MTQTILQRLEALEPGYGLMLEGTDIKDGWAVVASVIRASDGFDIQATWDSDRGAGIEPFVLRRTFTQARYAAEWLDGHLIEGASWADEAQPEALNQCDGCNRDLPLDDDGFHIDPSSALGAIGCDADLY